MKKVLLFVLIAFCGSNAAVKAQSFTIQADTVWTVASLSSVTHSYDTIAAPAPVSLTWRVLSTNFPADWLIDSVFGICDANLCRQNAANQLWSGLSGSTFTCTYPSATGSNDFHLQLDLQNTTSTGTYFMVVRVDDATTSLSRRMTFIISKFATSIKSVSNSIDKMVIFPNPVTSEAHISFDLNQAEQVQCTVYDLAGRSVLKAADMQLKAGRQQININTSDLANGSYTVSLSTSKGVVTQQLHISK